MNRARLQAGVALALLLGGIAAVLVDGLSSGTEQAAPRQAEGAPATTSTTTPRPPRRAVARLSRIAVRAVAAYDPSGDGRENDEAVRAATDADRSTAWHTERYRSFYKDGVGLVLDAGRRVRLARVAVTTGTPGFTAAIRVGQAVTGPFRDGAGARVVAGTTIFALRPSVARYVLVWITDIPDGEAADIAEVSARMLRPPR